MTSLSSGVAPMESGTTAARRAASTMTQKALAEIDSRLLGLDENLQHAMSDPGSEAAPRLQREISQAMARREWLLEQLLQMQRSGG
jgi:hypothetical protein